MLYEKGLQILRYFAEQNPLFGDRYYLFNPNEESETQTIDDRRGNHLFGRFVAIAGGDNVTLLEEPYTGCGGYRMNANFELYAVLEPCYRPEKVWDVLMKQVGGIDDVVITSGGFDAAAIYTALTNETLPRQITLIKMVMTVSLHVDFGEFCNESICEDVCC